jgi:hypothetical protein
MDNGGHTKCREGAWGIFLRKYKLVSWESNLNLQDGSITEYRNGSSVWRAVDYYTIIRERILLKKVCPNFILMYSYFRCPDNLDLIIKDKKNLMDMKNKQYSPFSNLNIKDTNCMYEHLLILTEGVQYTLVDWMQNKYQYLNNKRFQINSTVHSIEVWKSIFFMIWAGLAVLNKLGIFIPNFGKDNILIRNLISIGKDTGYWIYNINNRNYYIQNYGYVPLIDLNPTPLKIEESDLKQTLKNESIKSHNLIDGFNEFFDCYSTKYYNDNSDIIDKIKNINETECSNINNINNNWEIPSKRSSKAIPEELYFILGECNKNNISDPTKCIELYMRDYLHNRIGTRVRIDEILITDRILDDLREGELVAYLNLESNKKEYYWGLNEKQTDSNNRLYNILCCDRDTSTQTIWYVKKIPIENLSKLIDTNKEIQQDIIGGISFDSKSLLETYNITHFSN